MESPRKNNAKKLEIRIRLLKNQYDQYFSALQYYVRLGDRVRVFLWIECVALLLGTAGNILGFSVGIPQHYVPLAIMLLLIVGWIILIYIESKTDFNSNHVAFLSERINELFSSPQPFEYSKIYQEFNKTRKHDVQGIINYLYIVISVIIYLISAFQFVLQASDAPERSFKITAELCVIITAFIALLCLLGCFCLYYRLQRDDSFFKKAQESHLINPPEK